jgi:hypothetical protein
MKKLTLNDISTMELMDLSSKLEMTNTLSTWGTASNNKPKTESETWDCLFTQAFGFDWDESELYRLIRTEYIPKVMNIVNHFTNGYVTCMDK